MSLIEKLKKKYVNAVMSQDPRFSCSRQQQEAIIAKYHDPADLIERSFFQFRVQKALLGKRAILFEISSFFILIYKFIFTERRLQTDQHADLVCFLAGIQDDMIPNELKEKYGTVYSYHADGREYLDRLDRQWFFKRIVKRYPLNFFFQLKILTRLCSYSYLIHAFHPNAIANHCEYSCGSSAMTQYCHDHGIKHINFMHGEKVWYIRDSFFQFDECYVWNEHYSKLFLDLKAAPNQFTVAVPPKFLSAKNPDYQVNPIIKPCDYCYYLANESHAQIQAIFGILCRLKDAGSVCRVRLHPRWGDHAYVRMIAKEADIEVEMDSIDINDSILTTKYAISLFSTVLLQSYILNVRIIIDDLTCPERFQMLKELDYVALSLPHMLLSEI